MKFNKLIVLIFLFIALGACKENYIPKPYGYFRIDFPEKHYSQFSPENCPFTFDYPDYGQVVLSSSGNSQPCWYNIKFPDYKGVVHLSYKQVDNNLNQFIEDSRELTYKHSVKADAISEQRYANEIEDVYGLIYRVRGEAASSVQFFVTDSTQHFLRGALYFNVRPNRDSLAPAIDFFEQDIVHLINSFKWK